MFRKRASGQTFIEYTLMIGILITVMVAMTPMMRRGIQAMVKVAADQVGNQRNSDQIGGRYGHLINSVAAVSVQQDIETRERIGVVGKNYDQDQTFIHSNTFLNQGFTPREN